MSALAALALVGVLHVHHAPSHDSEAPFAAVVVAAHRAQLDFLVLTEHVPEGATGALLAVERAGRYTGPAGRDLLVMVGAEFGTRDGHLLGLDIPELVPAAARSGRAVIESIHELGGFAVVPHPFHYGGWRDWDAPFDGLEVQNHAAAFRRALGPLLPLRLIRAAFDRGAAMRALLGRPARELARWEELLRRGRSVWAFSGADAHRNLSIAGWQLDPYEQLFRSVKTVCPEARLVAGQIWAALRSGRCFIRYSIHNEASAAAQKRIFPSGRVELQLEGGRRVLEIRQPLR